MNPTKEQLDRLNKILENNKSLVWDGKFRWYSDGAFSVNLYWDFDETKEIHKILISK